MSPERGSCNPGYVSELPRKLDGADVLSYAAVAGDVRPTSRTRHVARGVELGPASALAIARYPNDQGFYLFYLDETGTVVTDTYHDSVEQARAQAAFEYRALNGATRTTSSRLSWASFHVT